MSAKLDIHHAEKVEVSRRQFVSCQFHTIDIKVTSTDGSITDICIYCLGGQLPLIMGDSEVIVSAEAA